ncbi:MAG: aminotransferase class V-fold PLP-dependent enzyme [Rhodothermales bacterium]|nr:aminotransferase class V-fold PLP-dependent enzyme [Rhodothermales bacterium]
MKSSRRKFLSTSTLAIAGSLAACRSTDAASRGLIALPPTGRVDDEEYWQLVRLQYPLTTDRVYLNTGGLGPAPYTVLDAVNTKMMSLQRLSETGHTSLDSVRPDVARFIGVQEDEIAFTRNATEGNATVASGLKLERGDEVIFESHAHPGGAMAWMVRQKEDGIKVKIFEPSADSGEENLQRIKDLVTPATRVIQVSHVTAPTGIRMPVKEIAAIARDAGAWFHVDGAQSLGMIEMDLSDIGCDSYASSGHKWLGAPHGTGILFVRRDRQDEVRPTEAGAYTNSDYELPDVFDYTDSARRYESGTRDASTVAGIHAAVQFQEQIGTDLVEERGQYLGRYLRSQVREIDGVTVISPVTAEMDSAMSTVKLANIGYRDLYRYLIQEHQLRCRIVSERGIDGLRISTHIFNTKADCDRVIEGIRQATRV